jgi:hypothetical protein
MCGCASTGMSAVPGDQPQCATSSSMWRSKICDKQGLGNVWVASLSDSTATGHHGNLEEVSSRSVSLADGLTHHWSISVKC